MNQSAIIHCKPEYLSEAKELELDYTINEELDGEVDIKVPDVEYDPEGYYVDRGEQLCDYYGIDFDQVNHIEWV